MKKLKLLAGLLACISAAGVIEVRAADALLGQEAAKTMPIADAHFHVMPFMNPAELTQYMDRHGIRWAGGAGSPGGPAKLAEAAAALGKRFIRATGQGPWITLKDEGGVAALENADGPAFQKRLAAMEADLRDNGARVIGEIHVNSLTSQMNPRLTHKIKADAPTLKAMFDLAGKYKRPLNMHAELDGDTAREIAKLAESNRGARLILSHCGSKAAPSEIRELMERNANVSCDLSYRSPPQLKGRVIGRTIFSSGRLNADWKKLIEDYPDRFIVGIDDVLSWADYDGTVDAIRTGLLANLAPEVAEKVAYKNAQAWFELE